MPIRETKTVKPTVHPTVDPDLLELVYSIYDRWNPQEFANAIAQYRREHEQARLRADINLDIARLKNQLDDL